jgi:hypothetical protein
MSPVGSHDNWSPLQEVWLGDVYPASWYDHLESEIRDCFYELTERTKQDLDIIEKKIQSFGVKVCRPSYDSIDNHINQYNQQLFKPEICPRDMYVTIGNTLFAKKNPSQANFYSPWQKHIDRYEQQGACVKQVLDKSGVRLNGATTVRAGQDLYFDLIHNVQFSPNDPVARKQFIIDSFNDLYGELFKDYRIHLLFNGGHVDACFALLKPGVILGNRYFSDDNYERTFPGWKLINVVDPQFQHHVSKSKNAQAPNGKWWLEDMSYSKAFNDHVLKHAQTWIGNYTETFFEVNCLVIDEHNIIVPGENEKVFKTLENFGIIAHPVPFRTRTFWDGGMHCITLDIRRQGNCVDLFPERGEPKILVYD